MNAIVEVATAETVAGTQRIVVLVTKVFSRIKVAIAKVVTSTKRVTSIAGTSISAVSPDYILIGGTA